MKNIKEIIVKLCNEKHYPYFLGFALYILVKIFKIRSKAYEIEPSSIKRKYNTLFIFGSGYSINSISQTEWEKISKSGDTMSLNFFFMGEFLPINYHIIREIAPYYSIKQFVVAIHNYFTPLERNPYYTKTCFFVRFDPMSYASTLATFFVKCLKGKKICYYANGLDISKIELPSNSLKYIPHCGATLIDAINIALILGYKNIILVGVDLYDRRYFWLRDNQTRDGDEKRGKTYKDTHNTTHQVLETLKLWYPNLHKKGIEVKVYNPKSLLAEIIPVFSLYQKKLE